jgi:diguanylate cyclase (GGDEF)-like protein
MKLFKLLSLIFVLLCSSGWVNHYMPEVKKGVVTLDNWDFSKDRTVSLKGEWDFYWESDSPKHLSTNQHSYMKVPSVWDEQDRFPSFGYGLYHLQVKGLQVGKGYALKVPSMSNSYHLWINDQLMVSNGTPGRTKQSTIPFYQPQEVYFDAHQNTVDIYLAISNFHYRSGGMWSSLELGSPDQITGLTKRNLAFETMLFGSLVLAGLYHIVLYIYRKQETILLLFGLSCLAISARTLVIGEQIIIEFFPKIPWEFIVKTEYLTFYTVVPLFIWFLIGLYPQEVSKIYGKALSVISLLLSLLVLFTPATIYTHSLFLYQKVTIITMVYIIAALVLATYRRRHGARVVLTCAAFYALTVINDILNNNRTIDSINLSSLGLFVFIFSQSYIIAKSASNAFKKVEQYSKELTELNQTLEEKISERTKSLETSTLELQRVNEVLKEMSYHDQLTSLPNRRYFDDLYEKEWENAITNQTMISILYLDIDHFKAYNDAYGHEQGDVTLQRVAICLQQSIQKYNGTVARIGGEEFVALILGLTPEQTNRIAEECRTDVKALQIPHKDSCTYPYVTISIGVATSVPSRSESKRKLIRTADEALYYAKEEGRNQVVVSTF